MTANVTGNGVNTTHPLFTGRDIGRVVGACCGFGLGIRIGKAALGLVSLVDKQCTLRKRTFVVSMAATFAAIPVGACFGAVVGGWAGEGFEYLLRKR